MMRRPARDLVGPSSTLLVASGQRDRAEPERAGWLARDGLACCPTGPGRINCQYCHLTAREPSATRPRGKGLHHVAQVVGAELGALADGQRAILCFELGLEARSPVASVVSVAMGRENVGNHLSLTSSFGPEQGRMACGKPGHSDKRGGLARYTRLISRRRSRRAA
jgi:hypothetical protein